MFDRQPDFQFVSQVLWVSMLVCRSFKTPTFCHVCSGFILGLGKKAERCSECFLTVHKKCVSKAPDNCIDKTDGELIPEEQGTWLNIEKNSDLSGTR